MGYYTIIFYTFLVCLIHFASSMLPYTMMSDPVKSEMKGLSHFSIDMMSFSGTKKLLIFGGTLDNRTQNIMMESKPQNKTTVVYNISGVKPVGRQGHCTLIYEYKMYMYGGTGENGSILTDLWEFNSIFYSWSHLSTSNQPLSKCKMMRNNTSILVFGIKASQQLAITRYSLLTNQWVDVGYSYASWISLQGKMWQGSTSRTVLSVDQMPGLDQPTTNLHFSKSIYSFNLHVFPFNSTHHLLLTDCKIALFGIYNQQLLQVRSLRSVEGNFQAHISGKWLFVIQQSDATMTMEYYDLTNFSVVGIQMYESPEQGSQFVTILIEGDIYFLSELSLDAWAIYEHCEWDQNLTNIANCFYNKIHCLQGYVGPICNIPSCPNTLSLFDSSNKQQILYECSNHGKCTASGCICDQYWSGQDCSIYTRKQCRGQVVDNWPVINCECEEEATGGNSCEVKFCYNDCSQHGTCLADGRCACLAGYYGPDCSITIIEFPSATVSI